MKNDSWQSKGIERLITSSSVGVVEVSIILNLGTALRRLAPDPKMRASRCERRAAQISMFTRGSENRNEEVPAENKS